MLKVLGVHSNVLDDQAIGDGHAWLTLHFENGNSTSIGLWTSSLGEVRRVVKDPTGFMLGETFDVKFGLENKLGYRAKASRFYALTKDQALLATKVMGAFTGWRFANTCATWATDVVKRVVGEELPSSELAGATNTPRALGGAIKRLERIQPTSLQCPRGIKGNPICDALQGGG